MARARRALYANQSIAPANHPLLQDETYWFLAADFDKASWREDTSAFLKTCEKYRVPAYLEVSRSGNGGHVWIFFEQNVPASLARRLGAFLLTQTMENRHQLGLDSYDRFFPNQDTLPKGGFGNLSAAPLMEVVHECLLHPVPQVSKCVCRESSRISALVKTRTALAKARAVAFRSDVEAVRKR
jgi:hypothetical protein